METTLNGIIILAVTQVLLFLVTYVRIRRNKLQRQEQIEALHATILKEAVEKASKYTQRLEDDICALRNTYEEKVRVLELQIGELKQELQRVMSEYAEQLSAKDAEIQRLNEIIERLTKERDEALEKLKEKENGQ